MLAGSTSRSGAFGAAHIHRQAAGSGLVGGKEFGYRQPAVPSALPKPGLIAWSAETLAREIMVLQRYTAYLSSHGEAEFAARVRDALAWDQGFRQMAFREEQDWDKDLLRVGLVYGAQAVLMVFTGITLVVMGIVWGGVRLAGWIRRRRARCAIPWARGHPTARDNATSEPAPSSPRGEVAPMMEGAPLTQGEVEPWYNPAARVILTAGAGVLALGLVMAGVLLAGSWDARRTDWAVVFVLTLPCALVLLITLCHAAWRSRTSERQAQMSFSARWLGAARSTLAGMLAVFATLYLVSFAPLSALSSRAEHTLDQVINQGDLSLLGQSR
jgi:hypothetical protein